MRKNRWRKLLALGLSLSMILSMAACGNSGQDTQGNGTKQESSSSQSSAETERADAGPVDWKTPYEETVTITTVNGTASNAQWTEEGDDVTNNIWTRAFKDNLNIEVVTTWTSDDYDTKLNLDISTQNLPDVFKVNEVQLTQLIEAGALMDLTEVYETYASDTLKKLMNVDPSIIETARKDGALYAIPKTGEVIDANLLYLREDWLTQLGKKAPATVTELEELLLDFMEISGGYGYATDSTLGSLYNIANIWGAYPTIWHKNAEGRVINGMTSPQMKEAVAAWANWYQKGILKADFATMNDDAVKQDLVNGNVGAYGFASWFGWYCGTDMVNNLGLECYMLPYEIPTVSGEKPLYPLGLAQEGYIVVSKDCKNPEAVVKLIDYFCYVVYDALGLNEMAAEEVEQFTAGNRIHAMNMFKVGNINISMERRSQIAEAIETGDTSVLVDSTAIECYNGTMKWLEEQDTASFPYWNQFGAEGGGLDRVQDIVEDDRFMRNAMWGVTPDEWLNYGSTLSDIMLEGFTKIIVGEESIDYFDTLVEQWYTAGGQECEDVMNALYN